MAGMRKWVDNSGIHGRKEGAQHCGSGAKVRSGLLELLRVLRKPSRGNVCEQLGLWA